MRTAALSIVAVAIGAIYFDKFPCGRSGVASPSECRAACRSRWRRATSRSRCGSLAMAHHMECSLRVRSSDSRCCSPASRYPPRPPQRIAMAYGQRASRARGSRRAWASSFTFATSPRCGRTTLVARSSRIAWSSWSARRAGWGRGARRSLLSRRPRDHRASRLRPWPHGYALCDDDALMRWRSFRNAAYAGEAPGRSRPRHNPRDSQVRRLLRSGFTRYGW